MYVCIYTPVYYKETNTAKSIKSFGWMAERNVHAYELVLRQWRLYSKFMNTNKYAAQYAFANANNCSAKTIKEKGKELHSTKEVHSNKITPFRHFSSWNCYAEFNSA